MNEIMSDFQDVEYLTYLVQGLVNTPDAVSVERSTDELGVLLSIKVAKSDMGFVIGKEGSVAKAIRTLMRAIGAKSQSRLSIRIIEPEGSDRPYNRRPANVDQAVEALQ